VTGKEGAAQRSNGIQKGSDETHFVQVVVLPEPCSPTNMTMLGLPFFRPLTPPPLPPFLSLSLSLGFAAPL